MSKLQSLLTALVGINSVNPFQTAEVAGKTVGIGCEAEVQSFLENLLLEHGFHVEKQLVQEQAMGTSARGDVQVPRRWNVLAEKGVGKHSILLFGHTDTVDVKEGWKTNPFQLTSVTDAGRSRLYGLGAFDMKGGLAAALDGILSINPQGYRIKIAFLVDEEFWSFGAVRLLESSFLDDVVAAFVPEIGDSEESDPTPCIGLGRLGRKEFEFHILGKACHGADALSSLDALNAVEESAKLQVVLAEYCRRIMKEQTFGSTRVRNSAYLSWHSGGAKILSVPDKATFVLDRTFLPSEDPDGELTRLEGEVAQAKETGRLDSRTVVQVQERARPTPPCRAFALSASDPMVQYVSNIVQSVAGPARLQVCRSVADENRIAALGIPTLILSPQGHGAHTSAEWVDSESLELLSKLFHKLFALGSEIVSLASTPEATK